MEARPFIFPQPLHYSCHTCSGCCRGWSIVLTEAEAARFRDYDWAATRPRFQGREPLQPVSGGLLQTTHLDDGACIFLDDDNLCAIHKELGFDRKPLMCQHFPYFLIDTPDGVVASLDFACPSVAADDGRPIAEHEADMRAVLARWSRLGGELRARMARGAVSAAEPRVEARRGVPLGWADYLALDNGLQRALGDARRPLTERLLIVDELAARSADHAEPGAMQPWIEELAAAGWAPLLAAAIPPPSSLRQRALIAPAIAAIEGAWAERAGGTTSAAARVALATALVPSQRPVRLPTADASVALARMPGTRFAQDDPSVTGPLVRFLIAFIARKSLIAGTSVLQGSRNLALYFGTIRWYSVARAVMADRAAVEDVDVRYAVRLAEQTLSHSATLQAPRFAALVNFLFGRIAPARSLYPSRYPG